MEKRKPSYHLDAVKTAFDSVGKLNATGTALRSAAAIGFGRYEIIEVIQSMKVQHFQKSMTSYHDHRIWQDVYNIPTKNGVLYVKFTAYLVTEFLLLSFKDLNND